MKIILLIFFLCSGGVTVFSMESSPRIRQPEKQEWKMDLTDECMRNDGLSMAAVLARERVTTADDAGRVFTYTLTFDYPGQNAPHGLLLEFDNGEVVESLTVDGSMIKPIFTKKPFWLGAECSFLLPERKDYRIDFRVRHLTQLYPNAFGRIILRPASFNDVFALERQPETLEYVWVRNSGHKVENVTLYAEYTDYFGVRTGNEQFSLLVEPGKRKKVLLKPDPKRWKANLYLEQNGKYSWSYRDYPHPDRWFTARPETLPITDGWEKCLGGPGAERGEVPRSGWSKAGGFPLILNPKTEKSHFYWLKTRVAVPENWTGKELYLGIPMVRFKADIFINGIESGAIHLWETPAKFNISNIVKPGETFELTLCLTDYIAALLPGTKIPEAGIYGAPSRSLTAAVGHFPAGGYPGLKAPPELLAESAIRTEHVFIKPRISGGKRLDIDFELVNNTANEQQVTLESEIFKQGKPIFRFPVEKPTLKAKQSMKFNCVQNWETPELWSPESPVLYEMRLTLKRPDGTVLDVRRERFGFREIGINENHFTLNGNPVRFYGFSQTTPKNMTWPFVSSPQTFYRYHFHDDGYYMGGIGHNHISDELGIFAKAENLSHNAHHGERFAYQDSITWERLYREMYQVFRMTCNMPSIAFWDIGNENNFSASGEMEKMGELFKRLAELDPTRPITIGGAFPLPRGEAVKVLDTHSMCDIGMGTYFFMHPEKRPEYSRKKGRFNMIPPNENPDEWEEGKYFRESYDPFFYRKNLLHFGNRPVIFGESMYMHAHSMPGLSGDSIYTPGVSGNYQMLSTLLGRKYMLRLTRKADVAAVLGHVARFHGREISPVAAFSSDLKLRFRSGDKLILPYDIYNFTSHPDTVFVKLLLKEQGKTVAEKTRECVLAAYESRTLEFDFGAFAAEKNDRRFDLLISVSGTGGGGFEDWEEIALYCPDTYLPDAETILSVYDPAGIVCQWLSARKIEFNRLDSPAEWQGGEHEFLVVGPEALHNNEEIVKLAAVLRKGGSILVLEHESLPDLTSGSLVNLKYGSVGVYPLFRPESPLYGFMSPGDLRFWNTKDRDLRTVCNMIKLPVKGNFRILATGAYEDGIKAASTALLDFGVGKGVVRYCQFNLSGSLGNEPAADRLLYRLLNSPPMSFGSPAATSVLVGENSRRILTGRSGVVDFADTFGALELTKIQTLVSDGKRLVSLNDSEAQALREWLLAGGKLLLLDAGEHCEAGLRTISGNEIRFAPFALDRARFSGTHPLTRGLSSGDLFWNAGKSGTNRSIRTINESKGKQAENSDPAHFKIICPDAVSLTVPAYLSAVSIGKGEIILSTLRLYDSPTPEAERLLSSLLTNAGVILDPGHSASVSDADQEARNGWTYTPISLASFCNRAFQDDPSSKIRGWSAQGPNDDLSAFPTGKQLMRGVMFNIVEPQANDGKGLIAMSGTREIGVLPSQIKDIPVKRKFERLVFLYGSAWGAPQFTIRVNYADRKTWIPGAPDPYTEILMRPKLEIDDWYMADTYLSGGGSMPRAKLAWSGYSRASKRRERHIGVFLYEWDNPFPEKEIDSIDIESPGKVGNGQLFILAISGADCRKEIPLEQLLPKWSSKRLLKRLEWSNYGIVIDQDGSIPAIYHIGDAKPLFSSRRWLIQGRVAENGKTRHRFFDGAPSRPESAEFSARNIRLRYKSKFLEMTEAITLKDTGVNFDYEFRILQEPPEEIPVSLILPFTALNGTFGAMVNTNPLMIDWNGIAGSLTYNSDYRWHKGYYGNKNNVSFTPFYNNSFRKGEVRKLHLRLNLP